MTYKVNGQGRYTFEQACKLASQIFWRTGVVVAVEAHS